MVAQLAVDTTGKVLPQMLGMLAFLRIETNLKMERNSLFFLVFIQESIAFIFKPEKITNFFLMATNLFYGIKA